MLGNLLLVDDDVAVLQFLLSCVADIAELRVARTGADALRLVRHHRPDLLLLDLHLGDTDGLTLLDTLRRDPALAGVPVIFLSGDGEISPRVRALDLDVLDWLVKPLDAQRLRARVQAAMRRGARQPAGGAAPAGLDADGPLQQACVLAVDDNPIALEALRLALAPEGFRVVTAGNAAEAMLVAAADAPEVVLIDMMMPGEDGFALAHRLMAMPAMADAPLIFVTQRGDAASEVRALGLGAFDFISKPVVPAVLRARVRNAVRLRRRAAQAMQHAELRWRQVNGAQLAAIVANAHDAIISVDGDGRIVLANDAARPLLGGAGPADAPLAGTPLPAWLRAALPAALLRGEQGRAGNVVLRAPGQPETVYDVAATVLAQEGRRLVTLTLHDQTTRIEAERQSRLQATLEAEGRSRQLMLSYLAHEIGNPLNGIIGLARVLLAPDAEPLTAQQRRRLTLVADSAEVLHRLMGDALDLARWQVGRFSVDIGAVPLRDTVQGTLGALAELAARSGVRLAEPSGDLDVSVRADPQRLRQCLHNLVSNACKYGRPGGRVQVDVVAGAQDVEIAVSDDGIGLSQEQVANLFQPFERLGRQGPAGHGLGLAVTRMLAQAMAGRLEVVAEEGVGSRFTLALPRHTD